MSDTAQEAVSGIYLHLQRMSTEDGPGLRTTVFLKGCSLRCEWCHNPESLSPKPQVQWLENRCIGCQSCIQSCPNGCLEMNSGQVTICRERCKGCGTCAQACPSGAMELLGRPIELQALCAEALKDRAYYQASGGGVTVSGGEPLLQADFVALFFQKMQAAGVETALDTCGMAAPASLEKVLPYTDLVLYDLKEIDPLKHKAFTGQSNEVILRNLQSMLMIIRRRGLKTRLWVRTPLIPGATARRENLLGIGQWLAGELDGWLERWELCAFNNLCRDKYRRLGMDWKLSASPLLTKPELEQYESWAKQSGLNPEIIASSGATRIER
jgi:pyruvate formate lyase activating enzyme